MRLTGAGTRQTTPSWMCGLAASQSLRRASTSSTLLRWGGGAACRQRASLRAACWRAGASRLSCAVGTCTSYCSSAYP